MSGPIFEDSESEYWKAMAQQALADFGYYCTMNVPVQSAHPSSPVILANYFTNGLPETMGHRDFQIVAPIPPTTAMTLFHGIVANVRSGKKYEDKDIIQYHEICGCDSEEHKIMRVKLILNTQDDREVLLMIFSDRVGEIEEGSMMFYAACQYQAILPTSHKRSMN